MKRERLEQIRDEVRRAAEAGFEGQDLRELHQQLVGDTRPMHFDSRRAAQKSSSVTTEKT